jgi:sarcosine oxidase, subunit gamma
MSSLALDPIAHRADDLPALGSATSGSVKLSTVPFLAEIDLRLDPAQADRAPYPIPTEPNTTWEEGPRAALWLGPDEWLVLGPPMAGPEIVAELEQALAGLHRSIVDVSANRVALELSGPARFDLLSAGCTIDLHSRTWGPGMCAQTLFGRAQVILHERADTTGILVRPSFADYVIDRLLDAAAAAD